MTIVVLVMDIKGLESHSSLAFTCITLRALLPTNPILLGKIWNSYTHSG